MQVKEKAPSFLGDERLRMRLMHCKELPSPPGVAVRILELSKDPSANFSDVADVVSLDPALATKVLRVANSPIYAKQRSIDNLRQAIMVLGLNGTQTLALSFSLLNNVREVNEKTLDHNLLWRRSLEAACACRQLGKRLGFNNTEELFLAGLLSDIGVLALARILPDLYPSIANLQHDHQAFRTAEQGALGADHATVGAWLLEHWKLPARWVAAVAGSHDPDAAAIEPEYLTLAQCTAVASDLADLWCCEDMDATLSRAARRARQWLKIDQEVLGEIVEAVAEETRELAPLFEIDLGDTILMMSLMEEAREMLVTRNLHQLHETDRLQRTTRSLESRTRELEQQSRRDHLTEVYNRAFVDAVLKQEFQAALTHGWPLAVLFVDLDHFKHINDTYGHQAGDQVLRNTAAVLLDVARETDIVARYGGEEFLVLLPGTGIAGAMTVAERLLTTLRETNHKLNGDSGITVTGSIGIAVQGEPATFNTPEDLVAAADRALYAAKFGGRDQAVVYNEQLTS